MGRRITGHPDTECACKNPKCTGHARLTPALIDAGYWANTDGRIPASKDSK